MIIWCMYWIYPVPGLVRLKMQVMILVVTVDPGLEGRSKVGK